MIVEVASHFLLALGVFGSLASREEATMGLLRIELSIFQCSLIPSQNFSPLKQWVEHEKQFPYLGFFTC
jgi:hypothetical protein